MKFALKNLFFILLIFVLTFNAPAAHTYHTTLTRIDYNEKEKLAEISIQMFPHDLVPVLEKRTKKNIDLEKKSEVDEIILKYLSENFILKDKKGEIKKIVWVGKEAQADTIFIFVEIPLDKNFDGFNLQNTLFFESFPEQTNLVIARDKDKKSDLLFKVGDNSKEIKLIDNSK